MKLVLVATFLGCLIGLPRDVLSAEPPKALEIAVPGYPRMPSGAREEGEVRVELEISKDGQVVSAKATTGPQRLRSSAEAAARKWRFVPSETAATREDVSVVFAFVLQRGLADPPTVAATFKAPNRVEVVAERRDVVIIADPPVEDVVRKRNEK